MDAVSCTVSPMLALAILFEQSGQEVHV